MQTTQKSSLTQRKLYRPNATQLFFLMEQANLLVAKDQNFTIFATDFCSTDSKSKFSD
jgi:hypothetical protein